MLVNLRYNGGQTEFPFYYATSVKYRHPKFKYPNFFPPSIEMDTIRRTKRGKLNFFALLFFFFISSSSFFFVFLRVVFFCPDNAPQRVTNIITQWSDSIDEILFSSIHKNADGKGGLSSCVLQHRQSVVLIF